VIGHSTARIKTLKEELNIIAENLAGTYAKSLDQTFKPRALPLARPNYKVRLLHNNSAITVKQLYKALSTAQHSATLQNHIMKKANMPIQFFNLIGWNANERYFMCLTRGQQIATTKIIHQLVNTNRQNNIYYGSSPLCPCCLDTEETFQHVLSCPAISSTGHQIEALAQLFESLCTAGILPQILAALKHGMDHWMSSSDPSTIRSLTADSLHAGDTLLRAAFLEQYQSIGWYQLFLRRISQKWEKAYAIYKGSSSTLQQINFWTSMFISSIWKHTKALWNHRNKIVHGSTAQLPAKNRLKSIKIK
jgi:hypothetical protein